MTLSETAPPCGDTCVECNWPLESCRRVHVVRMGMTVADSERLSEVLLRLRGDLQSVADRIHDQLWLRTVLIEQRRRTPRAERATFDARADGILELLDSQELAREAG